jgi:general secretion pathway protein K
VLKSTSINSILGRRRRGSALLLVLILGATLTSLTLVGMRVLAVSLRATAVFVSEVEVEELGRSGIDLALAHLSRLPVSRRMRGSFDLKIANGSLAVQFVSETARVDLNMASADLLSALLIGLDVDQDMASRLANEIVDWRTPDSARRPNATPDDAYLSRGLPLPRKRAFTDTLEVAQVLDMTPLILARLLPLLTVCSGQKKIDPLLADKTMLHSLFGGDDRKVISFGEQSSQPPSRPEDVTAAFPETIRAFLQPAITPAAGQRLHIVARAGGLERQFDASICPASNRKSEPDVLAFRAL